MSDTDSGGLDTAPHLLSDRRRRYYTVQDVADYLNVSGSYVYKLVNEGTIPAHKFGRAVRISRDEVLRYERNALAS